MSEHITHSDLKDALAEQREGIQAAFRSEVRGLVDHFNRSQGEQNKRLERIDGRLDQIDGQLVEMRVELAAVKELLVFRKEVRALVRELKAQGIQLDESRIFAG